MADALEMARQLEAEGLLDEAIALHRQLAAGGEADADARIRCATLLRQRGRIPEAVAELQAAIAQAPNNPWPWHRLGELHGQCGRNLAAFQHMRTAMELAPDGEEFRVNVAAVSGPLGWYDVGFSAARGLRPDVGDWWAGARQGALDRYRAERAAALALLRERRLSRQTTPELCWALGPKLIKLGRLGLARRLVDALIAQTPTSHPAYYMLADIVLRQSGVDAAIDFVLANPVMRDDPRAYCHRLGRLLHEAGRHQELLDTFEQADLSEDDELRWLHLTALLMLNAKTQLRAYCQDWLTNSPDALTPAATLAGLRALDADLSTWRAGEPILVKPHICQFWDKPDIPGDVRGVMLSWTAHNPEVDYTVFDDAGARAFLATHFGSAIVQTYDACHHPAMKADYFRVALLYQAGGVYADADELCLRPLGHILAAAEAGEIVAALSGDLPGYVHNFFLASRPRSRIMRWALEDATRSIAATLQAGQRPGIWGVTGPGLITRAIGTFLATQPLSWEREDMLLLGRQQYASYARTESRLAYKSKAETNWTVA